MSPELESVCRKSFKKTKLSPSQAELSIYEVANYFHEAGFKAAIESEQVQSLVRALKEIRSYSLGSKADICDEALKDWV